MKKFFSLLLIVLLTGCTVEPTSCYISELDLHIDIIPERIKSRIYFYRHLTRGGDYIEFYKTIPPDIRFIPPRTFYVLCYVPTECIEIKNTEFDIHRVERIELNPYNKEKIIEWSDSTVFKIPNYSFWLFEHGAGFSLHDIDGRFVRNYTGKDIDNEIYIHTSW